MALHFNAGKRFRNEAALLTGLHMAVSIGEESERIDLMGFVKENGSQPPVELSLNQSFVVKYSAQSI